MGSAIAAHFANAGVPSLVLDIVPRELTDKERAAGLTLESKPVRDRLARDSVHALTRSRPSALFSKARMALIETGNLEDDLPRLREADWVIEVVKEDMGIKKKVLAAAAEHVADGAVVTSNTSGLSLGEMAAALPEGLRPRFLGTHFFNPPRYMRLVELIPTEHTAPEVIERIREFTTQRLGKGVVPVKDTPNFVANRIGTHAMFSAVSVMQELGLTIEEVDTLTGPPLGRPKTGTFRLSDLVGLDTLLLVAGNVYDGVPGDESRDVFAPPAFLQQMIEKGLLGLKTRAGFYKKVKRPESKILVLDLETLDYRDQRKPELPELKALKGIDDAAERIRTLVGGEGRAATAAWKLLAPTLSYSALRLGEIADDADTVDRAIRLGFNWELGPFEVWDALGFRPTVERLRADGYPLPDWIDRLYQDGATSLYEERDGRRHGPTPSGAAAVHTDPRHLDFDGLRARGRELKSNPSASLFDLGEGVLGLEFHSKMNAIDGGTVEMIFAAADEAEASWQALVLANEGVNFCAGANLMMLVEAASRQDWKAIEGIVSGFQQSLLRLERCAVPVVVAPHGMALGGGAEVVLAGNAVHAAAEAYIGLVEVGAGLLPAGGGCLRLYQRNVERLTDGKDVYPALRATFESIGMAKVSTSAEEARELGFLRGGDGWSMNREHVTADARDLALALSSAGWAPPPADAAIPVMGRSGVALVEAALVNMAEGRFISEHDRKIGREIGRILAGGDVAGPTTVSATHIMDLEREGFLRLCGEPKTHERIEALLKTGKPLRN
jgi:3-hydroxyacyl-CoA dehydrogenase